MDLNAAKENNVVFHFDVRLDDKVLVRNTKTSGWGVEERYLNVPYPFAPNKFFEMVIQVEQSGYKVCYLMVNLSIRL